jgi:hypothetical protein
MERLSTLASHLTPRTTPAAVAAAAAATAAAAAAGQQHQSSNTDGQQHVLVVGGTGLIGRSCAEHFASQVRPWAVHSLFFCCMVLYCSIFH